MVYLFFCNFIFINYFKNVIKAYAVKVYYFISNLFILVYKIYFNLLLIVTNIYINKHRFNINQNYIIFLITN